MPVFDSRQRLPTSQRRRKAYKDESEERGAGFVIGLVLCEAGVAFNA